MKKSRGVLAMVAVLTGLSSARALEERGALPELRSRYLAEPVELTAGLDIPLFEFSFQPETSGLKTTTYKPNSQVNVGTGLRYRGYGGMIMLPLPSDEKEIRKKGKTSHFDIVLSKSFDWGSLDFFFSTYRGFYKEKDGEYDKNFKNEVYPQRPDVNTRNFGLNTYYMLKPEKYHVRWESNRRGRGFKHSGSVLFIASANNFRVWGDHSLLEASDGILPDDHNQLRAGEFTSLSAGGGYGHEMTYDSNRMKMQMLLGFGPQWQRLESEAAVFTRTMAATKLAMTLNYEFLFEDWRFGMDMKFDQVTASLGSVRLESQVTSLSLFARAEI